MNKIPQSHTVKPQTKEELEDIIRAEINKNGNQCGLNHIDTSLITDFNYLFYLSKFNGDISGWNVSNVRSMSAMFYSSEFNGDISKWDVSRVKDMNGMFYLSRFNGDISDWNRFSVIDDKDMFLFSKMAEKIGIENPNFEQVKSRRLSLRLEAGLQEVSLKQPKKSKVRL